MTTIYDLSWKKTSFIFKLCLLWASITECRPKIKSENSADRAIGYSALSSTCYSIYRTAGARFKAILRPKWLLPIAPVRIVLWCITWLPFGGLCYWCMLPLSNKMNNLLDYDSTPADMCDIRQSILRARRHYDEAKICIDTVIRRSKVGSEVVKMHTLGLLHIGLAEIYVSAGSLNEAWEGEKEIEKALNFGKKAEETDPLQAVRIYGKCSELLDLLGYTARVAGLRRKAKDLASEHNAKDQLLKLSV